MRNISKELFNYAEASRHLWNVYFQPQVNSLYECSPIEEYEAIDKLLFVSLVANKIGQPAWMDGINFRSDPIPIIVLRPKSDRISLMISQSQTSPFTWSKSELIDATGFEFQLIEFFDWDRYDFLSYSYYRAQVTNCPNRPEFKGKQALFLTTYADAFAEEREAASSRGKSN